MFLNLHPLKIDHQEMTSECNRENTKVTKIIVRNSQKSGSIPSPTLTTDTSTDPTIIKALSNHSVITELYLSDLKLSDDNGRTLAMALKVNLNLRSLIFDATLMSTETKDLLIKILNHYNRNLTNLLIYDHSQSFGKNYRLESELISGRNFTNKLRWKETLKQKILQHLEYQDVRMNSPDSSECSSQCSVMDLSNTPGSSEDNDSANRWVEDFDSFSGKSDGSDTDTFYEEFPWNKRYDH
ncbi:MAG: hypothetical protein ACHQUC_08600 [Chlamydiales bacterium]